jgi:peroxiredoxin
MGLQEELNKTRDKIRKSVAPDILATMDQCAGKMAESGITERCIKEGDMIPLFSLPNVFGKTVRIADLLKRGPVVLSFYRGHWCPFCNLELLALQESLPKIRRLGADLVAISPQTPDNSLYTAEKRGLSYEVLSDAGNHVAKHFGLVHPLPEELRPIYKDSFEIDLPQYNGDESYELPVPATYVADQEGIIRKAFVDCDYTKRMDPGEIISVLRRIKAGR